MEQRWDDTDRRKQKYRERNLSKYHFVQHKWNTGSEPVTYAPRSLHLSA
jgi:hypothetical protein